MSITTPLALNEADRSQLRVAVSGADPDRPALRARIVLMAAQGASSAEIARRLSVSRPTVIEWRKRFAAEGLNGLSDCPRSGRPREINETYVVAATCARPPRRLGRERWSARSLSSEIGVSLAGTGRIWKRWGLRPHQDDALLLPVRPSIAPWSQEVSGLYLNPPECALAVTFGPQVAIPDLDELSRPATGAATSRTCVTDELIAATRFVAGRVVDACPSPQQHELFLEFLAELGRRYPARAIHVILRDDTSLEHPETRLWLTRNPAVRIHRASQCPPWSNIVELLLYTSMVRAGVPGALATANRLAQGIQDAVAEWREDAGHFTWTEPIVSPFVARKVRA